MSESEDIREEERRAEDSTVDPLLRAHVQSLCNALGGPSNDGTNTYVLGDEAQLVLRDLKKWLKGYDERLNRLDVARCLAEANLVSGDLVQILAMLPDDFTNTRILQRLALSCMELLVPLTWPLETNKEKLTVNIHRHSLFIKFAQAGYKRALLHGADGKVLPACVRVALASIEKPPKEREPRDEGIIRLLFYLVRNVALIEHPMPTDTDTGEDISRSATIEAFEKLGLLHLLLVAASGMGEEFNIQDVVVLEIIYHLVKGVDIEKLFKTEDEAVKDAKNELDALLKKEKAAHSTRDSVATRHNRFGSMIWVNTGNGKRATVSGQDVLRKGVTGLEKVDAYKKWKRPDYGKRFKGEPDDVENPVYLGHKAKCTLRHFVEEFLDAGFNPLFAHIRKAIDRDEERFLQTNKKQYFHLVAWFLEAERMRRKVALEKNPKEVPESFALVGEVLNQESLIIVNRCMREFYDHKQWVELQGVLKCFTQILLTVQDMAASPNEDDVEIADNIQSRIFYEEAILDLVLSILRDNKRQTLGYLDTVTESVHVLLRMLEKYSKGNTLIFVKAKSQRKKKKKDASTMVDDGGGVPSEEEDERINANKVKEKRFEFTKYETKFVNQHCIDTFLAFLKYYKALSAVQIKRCIAFFHRVAVKREMDVALFRLDILKLLYEMAHGDDGLPISSPAYKEVDQFARHYIKKLVRKLQSEPALFVELLFSKSNKTFQYLQYGYIKSDAPKAPKQTRVPAEWEVKPIVAEADRIPIAVAVLKNENKGDALEWLSQELTKALDQRKAWNAERGARKLLDAAENTVMDGASGDAATEAWKEANKEQDKSGEDVPPDYILGPKSEQIKTAVHSNAKFRLLLRLSGAEIMTISDPANSPWVFPGTLSTVDLEKHLDQIKKAIEEPINLPENQSPEDLIRKKPKPRQRAMVTDSEGSDDEDWIARVDIGEGDASNEQPSRKRTSGGKKSRRAQADPNDPQAAARAAERERKRMEKEREALSKIKSSMYVHDSDEEWDEETEKAFFERERQLREQMAKLATMPAHLREKAGVKLGGTKKKRERKDKDEGGSKKKQRKSKEKDADGDLDMDGILPLTSETSDDEMEVDGTEGNTFKDLLSLMSPTGPDDDSDSDDSPSNITVDSDTDTPSGDEGNSKKVASTATNAVELSEDEDEVLQAKPVKRRTVIVDDDDE